ncbi:MAG: glycosyl hydrolase family 28 protein [Daejeonella sp.]|uniref:glycosyl hydrolase family 28 protein n=1 Tax=Daejeonella sp. TaxID=2805397 RepID=UPI002734ACD0|nr:glycosyl hydrolase family 28 protein [Daejeonella sp.]MDP3466708.1 glycosyl hydrolase family 28 protein [Daejeonella sp.]
MFRIKLRGTFFFLLLQCCILQIQTSAGKELKKAGKIVPGLEPSKAGAVITPNNFKGTDAERIQKAINAAKGKSNKVVIPMQNSKGGNIWKIDRAILLPSNMSLILDNCIIQLSDSCRDNMFRSDNVGAGITDPAWNYNISIIGIGDVQLRGADNPRSTGDAYRTLTLTNEKGRVSYGSDAGKEGIKQKGDWRNNMIQIAKVDGFKLKNITIKNSHAWAISFERTINVELSALRFINPEYIQVNGTEVKTYNKDGINLRHGCKYFRIDNITGINGDDLIALSSLDAAPYYHTNGDINSYQVTSTRWAGPEDDTEQVFITNCQTNYTGVAIRASDNASIHHVYINGVITKARPDTPPPYGGSPYTVLVGGRGYGDNSVRGKINNIYATNLFGDGKSLILVESQVSDCQFINGMYTGTAPDAITYNVDKKTTTNITEVNLIKVAKSQ